MQSVINSGATQRHFTFPFSSHAQLSLTSPLCHTHTLTLHHPHQHTISLSPPSHPTFFFFFLTRLPFFPAHCSHHCSSIHFHHLSSLTMFSSSAKTNRWPRIDSAPIFFSHNRPKEKVIVVMGATGAGKSSLSIDLATCFPFSEIINFDKTQVYRGLDITTNNIPIHECNAIPHHLLCDVHSENGEFTPLDFRSRAGSVICE